MENKNAAPERIGAIERDEQMQRDYIPLAGQYEFQTRGKGSTVRLLCPDGKRVPFSRDAPHVEKALEDCMRAQHAALTPMQPVPSESDEAVATYLGKHIQEVFGKTDGSISANELVQQIGEYVEALGPILARHRQAPAAADA